MNLSNAAYFNDTSDCDTNSLVSNMIFVDWTYPLARELSVLEK